MKAKEKADPRALPFRTQDADGHSVHSNDDFDEIAVSTGGGVCLAHLEMLDGNGRKGSMFVQVGPLRGWLHWKPDGSSALVVENPEAITPLDRPKGAPRYALPPGPTAEGACRHCGFVFDLAADPVAFSAHLPCPVEIAAEAKAFVARFDRPGAENRVMTALEGAAAEVLRRREERKAGRR